jgi:hypothetical protein
VSTYPTPPPSLPPTFGQSQLVVNIREPFGAMGMISPLVTIDGHPAPAQWGPNAYPTTPGQHHVRVWARYLFEYGAAEQVVDLAPGQSVEVHYSAPVLTFIRGRIGPSPQPRPGMVALLAVLGGVVLLIVLIIVLAIVTG